MTFLALRCGRGLGLAAAVVLCAWAGALRAWAADAPLAERIAQCAEVRDDQDRLHCYDAQARPRPAPDAIALIAQAPADPAPRPPRPRVGLRLDGGYGFSVGDYVGTISLAHRGTLKVTSQTGGAGGGDIADLWLDDWPLRDVSVGLQYIRIDNQGALDLTLPGGLAILTDPVYAHLGLRVAADVGMINFAYRPHGFGWLRPVIGVGVGAGSGYAAETDVLANPFLGQAVDATRSRAPFPLVQAFAGLDAQLPGRVYLSLTGRLMAINAHPIGQDQAYTDLVIGTAVGYKFR